MFVIVWTWLISQNVIRLKLQASVSDYTTVTIAFCPEATAIGFHEWQGGKTRVAFAGFYKEPATRNPPMDGPLSSYTRDSNNGQSRVNHSLEGNGTLNLVFPACTNNVPLAIEDWLNWLWKLMLYKCNKVRTQKKITGLFGNFSHIGGEGLPNSQNFCKLTKYFFVCQIHSEVLKHVLQRGGWWYLINFIT